MKGTGPRQERETSIVFEECLPFLLVLCEEVMLTTIENEGV